MHIDPAADRAMVSAVARRTARGPAAHLIAALLEMGQNKGELLRHEERAWASVTFSGARHTVALSFAGTEAIAAGEELIEALPDHEFAIPRQLVADAAVIGVEHTADHDPRLVVELELLLLDEG